MGLLRSEVCNNGIFSRVENRSRDHHARYLGGTIQVLVHVDMTRTDTVIIIISPPKASASRENHS